MVRILFYCLLWFLRDAYLWVCIAGCLCLVTLPRYFVWLLNALLWWLLCDFVDCVLRICLLCLVICLGCFCVVIGV